MSRAEERPSGIDRRAGLERRSGIDRRAEPRRTDEGHRQLSHRIGVGNAGQRAGRETEPGGLPLRRLFPYAQFNEREAADRSAAIEAHRRELSSRLGRNIGLSVAALDYLLHISHDLVDPTIVEQEALEVLERRSVTDPLTGLFNRHHFAATLKREVARCLRYSARLSLLLMDVDQLKAVNDRCGHQAGDQVLGRVAGAIRNSLRGADVACRYGGGGARGGDRAGRLEQGHCERGPGRVAPRGYFRSPAPCGSRSGALPGERLRGQRCGGCRRERGPLDSRVMTLRRGVARATLTRRLSILLEEGRAPSVIATRLGEVGGEDASSRRWGCIVRETTAGV